MTTLKTQYKNWLAKNYNSDINYKYWKENIHLKDLDKTKLLDKDPKIVVSSNSKFSNKKNI